jgi:hypothetical protein
LVASATLAACDAGASAAAAADEDDNDDEGATPAGGSIGPATVPIRGHQRSSEVIRGHQRSSEVISGSIGPATVPIRCHQMSSEIIRGHQRSSAGALDLQPCQAAAQAAEHRRASEVRRRRATA